MYPPPSDSPQFCYDQGTLQLYGASCDRSRLPGGGNNGMTEYVRQELRAMVGARTGVSQAGRPQQQQIQVGPGQQVSSADLEALGLSFEMPNTGGSESPKMWGNVGSEMSAVSPQPGISRTNMEEVSRSSDQKSSLLQKLLSE
uniref:Uncharacterized protein n=3 Tax=Clastoptera arizonana TaxID=38151 RepID=A0A1B6C442_9HEMI